MKMKKIEIKPLLITASLIALQATCYLIAKLIEREPYLIGNALDKNTPFIIYAIIPYCIWYIMLFLVPYIFYKKDKKIFSKYCVSYILTALVASIIFVIYPTTVARPEITGTSPIELITRLIFWMDTPILNCFPSLHCAVSMLWILYIFKLKDAKTYQKIYIPIISIIIMLSTLFLKQHVIADLISGDLLATIIFFINKKDNKLINKFEKLLKI